MNEPVREALNALKERIFEQNGTKVVSSIFIGLGSSLGDPNIPLGTISLEDIPKSLDNTRHDLYLAGHMLDIIRNRESIRTGRGPLPEFKS